MTMLLGLVLLCQNVSGTLEVRAPVAGVGTGKPELAGTLEVARIFPNYRARLWLSGERSVYRTELHENKLKIGVTLPITADVSAVVYWDRRIDSGKNRVFASLRLGFGDR